MVCSIRRKLSNEAILKQNMGWVALLRFSLCLHIFIAGVGPKYLPIAAAVQSDQDKNVGPQIFVLIFVYTDCNVLVPISTWRRSKKFDHVPFVGRFAYNLSFGDMSYDPEMKNVSFKDKTISA